LAKEVAEDQSYTFQCRQDEAEKPAEMKRVQVPNINTPQNRFAL
jgi:hypothetical protein